MDKTYLLELVRDVRPLWDQRDKKCYNRDLKAKLWDEIGEKFKFLFCFKALSEIRIILQFILHTIQNIIKSFIFFL